MTLALKLPPPVYALAFGFMMWLFERYLPELSLWARTSAAIVAYAIGALGVGIALAGVIGFRRKRTTINPHHPEKTTSLVSHGIYLYSRNPMYLGLLLLLISWGVQLGNLGALLILWGFIPIINHVQIKPEEAQLHQLFGEAYQHYCTQVRRWL